MTIFTNSKLCLLTLFATTGQWYYSPAWQYMLPSLRIFKLSQVVWVANCIIGQTNQKVYILKERGSNTPPKRASVAMFETATLLNRLTKKRRKPTQLPHGPLRNSVHQEQVHKLMRIRSFGGGDCVSIPVDTQRQFCDVDSTPTAPKEYFPLHCSVNNQRIVNSESAVFRYENETSHSRKALG